VRNRRAGRRGDGLRLPSACRGPASSEARGRLVSEAPPERARCGAPVGFLGRSGGWMGRECSRALSRLRFHDGYAGGEKRARSTNAGPRPFGELHAKDPLHQNRLESALTRHPSCPRVDPPLPIPGLQRYPDGSPVDRETLNEREASDESLDERAIHALRTCPNCPNDLNPCWDRVPNGRFSRDFRQRKGWLPTGKGPSLARVQRRRFRNRITSRSVPPSPTSDGPLALPSASGGTAFHRAYRSRLRGIGARPDRGRAVRNTLA